MKTKFFIVLIAVAIIALLGVAFVPGIHSRVFPPPDTSYADESAALIARLSAATPTPTPVPVPSPREEAEKKLGWLGIEISPESLQNAVAEKGYYTVGLLLTAGVDVDVLDGNGRTPLLIAMEVQDEKMLELLLERGADVNLAGERRAVPLVMAAQAGEIERMKRLLKAGAKVDTTDAEGRTVLFQMVENGQVEEFGILLDAGADWRREGLLGATPLETALRLGHAEIAEKLFALETEPRTEWTPFMRVEVAKALRSGDQATAELLLSHHPDVPKPDGAAQSLLAYAVAWNDFNTFKTLLACGGDPDERLIIPAEKAFIESVDDKELTFYLQNEQGMTLLMLAAGLGRLDFIEELLKREASTSARTQKYNMAAMSFAQRNNQTRAILLLMGKNPDPTTHTTRIAISLSDQQAVYYEDGVAVLRTPVSTGRKKYRTPTGDFVITDKHRSRISSIYEVEMPYFMRLNGSGYGMHEGYVPNYPASHGCIRLPRKAAKKLFSEVEVGTYVTITQ